jgi:kynurenine formamidase
MTMATRPALTLGTLVVLACACGGAPQAPAEADKPLQPALHEREIVDLTWTLDESSIAWPTSPTFSKETQFDGVTEGGWYYLSHVFQAPEHGGTHIDAPRHFFEGRDTTDTIPLQRLIGPGVTIDVSEACATDRDYLVGVADFEAWEAEHGSFPEGAIVLLRTGFGAYWPDRERYMGTAELGPGAVPKLHFPGLDPGAVDWLVARKIGAIGLDTPSIDHGPSTTFGAHVALFEQNIPAFENVAQLETLPPRDFTVIALPAKIGGGSGGPLRIVALL